MGFSRKQKIALVIYILATLCAGVGLVFGIFMDVVKRTENPSLWLQNLADFCADQWPVLWMTGALLLSTVILLVHFGILENPLH
jgi:hypothetical protein